MKPKKKKDLEPAHDPGASKRHWLAGLVLCVLSLAAYSNSFSAGFAWDSQYLILQDPRIRAATSENVGLILQHTYWWPTGEAGLYRPLTTLSYLFNYAILGQREQPAGYHWLNLILHTANALLVYALALRLVRRFWPSIFIAAIWSVHPALTESVTNIVGRSDLLAGLAALSGLLIYLKSTDATGSQRIAWLAGLMAVTILGVYTKESAVMIVGLIALYELTWWKERRQARSLILGFAATLPPIFVMLWQRASVLAATAPAEFPFTDNPIVLSSFWIGKLTAIRVIARYLWLTIWPAKLSIDYSYAEIPLSNGSVRDWLGWIAVAVFVAIVALLYQRNRTAFFLACFAALTLLPTANLLFPIGTIMAERFLYLPSVGLLGCLVIAIDAAGQKTRLPALALTVLCLITAAFAARTWARNLDWQDDLHLASAGVLATPNSYKLHKVLASTLYVSDASHSNLDRVTAEAEKTLAILDPLPDAANEPDSYRWSGGFFLSKGDALRKRGQDGAASYERARQVLLRCIAIQEAHDKDVAGSKPEVFRLLSAVYLRLGDVGQATRTVALARSLDPMVPEAYRQMAEVSLATGDGESAAIALMTGLLITSNGGVREDLLSLYQSGLDTKGCAIATGPNGPVMNPACEMVHRHVCAASVDVVQVYLRKGRRDQAESQRQTLVGNFGCPAAPLDQAIGSR